MLHYIWFPDDGSVESSLGDDGIGDKISGGMPVTHNQVVFVPLPEAEFQKPFNRGNRLTGLTWIVERDHGTEEEAETFQDTHGDSLYATGRLQRICNGTVNMFLQNAAIMSVRCVRRDGRSTVFEYTVQGGKTNDTSNL